MLPTEKCSTWNCLPESRARCGRQGSRIRAEPDGRRRRARLAVRAECPRYRVRLWQLPRTVPADSVREHNKRLCVRRTGLMVSRRFPGWSRLQSRRCRAIWLRQPRNGCRATRRCMSLRRPVRQARGLVPTARRVAVLLPEWLFRILSWSKGYRSLCSASS